MFLTLCIRIHHKYGLRTGYVGTFLILPALFHSCFLFKPSKFDLILLLNSPWVTIPFTEQLGTYSITNTLVGGRNTWISDTDPGFVITWCGEWCLFSKLLHPFSKHFRPVPSRDVTYQTLPGREYFIYYLFISGQGEWHPGWGRKNW